MKRIAPFALVFLQGCSSTQSPAHPLLSGTYVFSHRSAEHPNQMGHPLQVTIDGSHITVYNADSASVFPVGLVVEGTLLWHAGAAKWIIGSKEDLKAVEVGGCSDGPAVVDLTNKVFWSC